MIHILKDQEVQSKSFNHFLIGYFTFSLPLAFRHFCLWAKLFSQLPWYNSSIELFSFSVAGKPLICYCLLKSHFFVKVQQV